MPVKGPSVQDKRILACLVGRSAFAKKCLRDKLVSQPEIRINPIDSVQQWRVNRAKKATIFIFTQEASDNIERDLRYISRSTPGAKILLVGLRPTRESLFRLLESGVNGFLDVDEIDSKLVPALRCLSEGHTWMEGDKIAEIASRGKLRNNSAKNQREIFTPQEARVVNLVHAGYSNKQIGPELGISERTVKFHLSKIFVKLGITDRHQIPNPILMKRTKGQLSEGQQRHDRILSTAKGAD